MRPDPDQLSIFGGPVVVQQLTQRQQRDLKQSKILEHEKTRMEILRRAKEARRLGHDWTNGWLRYGVKGMVTSDMVNESLKIQKEVARSRYRTRNNMNGMMFRIRVQDKEKWLCLGKIESRKEGSNGNMICAWVFEKYWDRAYPEFHRMFDERGKPKVKDTNKGSCSAPK